LDYPDVDGGAIFGPTAGLGVLIDPVNPFSIVVEVPMTFVLSDGGASRTDPVLGVEPTTLESNGWVIRAILGVEVKL
jgi:hypothetical protein